MKIVCKYNILVRTANASDQDSQKLALYKQNCARTKYLAFLGGGFAITSFIYQTECKGINKLGFTHNIIQNVRAEAKRMKHGLIKIFCGMELQTKADYYFDGRSSSG